jgi:large subunit ribosomal protein L18e
MALSKTKVNQRMRKKSNSILAETIFLAKKNKLLPLASALSVPARKQSSVNISRINNAKNEVVIVPGKVLSDGEIEKKVKVYALNFSEKAKEKLKKAGCEYKTLLEALKKGEKLNGEIMN